MTKPLADCSDDDLIALFAENCISQDQALLGAVFDEESSERDEATASFKELFRVMRDIDTELRKRGPQSRLILTRLYDHPNPQVRLQAAKCSLAVAPVDARRVIEAIAELERTMQGGDARGTIRNLDTGFWKPT